jgi:imidazolonepropionase-like amidohydrolase
MPLTSVARPRLLLLGLSIALLPGAAAQTPPVTAFEHARLLIGTGEVIENGLLLVSGGRITGVGAMNSTAVPVGARRIDLTGKVVMPTLVDAHMHMGFENMESWGVRNYTRPNIVDTLDRLAYYGVGAAFSAGTDLEELALSVRRDQAAGRIGAARFVFAAGTGPPGAGPNATLLKELATLSRPVLHGITNDADARQAVRDIAARNIPIIKVWVTDRGGTQPKTAPEAYRGLIDEAHRRGLRVVAHATDGLADAKDLARAGLDGYLHAVLDVDDEFIALAKKNDAFVAPAQGLGLRGAIPGVPPWYEDPFFQEATPPSTIVRYRRQTAAADPASAAPSLDERLARAGAMVRRLLAGGIRVVVGTDAGALPDYPPGYPMHREMELYVRMGMTPDQVLVAATKAGAEALQIDKDLGTLQRGKVANLLVLDADPRIAIGNTRKIAAVYLAGTALDRDALRNRWNPTR